MQTLGEIIIDRVMEHVDMPSQIEAMVAREVYTETAALRTTLEKAERELSRLFVLLPITGPLPSPEVMQECAAALSANVNESLEATLGAWRVKASDYDRLADAARELRSACKRRLPPGTYWLLEREIDQLDGVLSPNTKFRDTAGTKLNNQSTQ